MNFLQIVLAATLNLLWIPFFVSLNSACSRQSSTSPQATPLVETQMNPLPNGVLVDPGCPLIPATAESSKIPVKNSEIALTLKDSTDQPILEIALLDSLGKKIPIIQMCTQSASTILIQGQVQQNSLKLYLRDNKNNRLYTLDGVQLQLGKRINFGLIQSTPGASFSGRVIPSTSQIHTGEIEELGWKFTADQNGHWKSGILPKGHWSVKIRNESGLKARWLGARIDSSEVTLGEIISPGTGAGFVPLWSGTLKESQAQFLMNAEERFFEMRLSLDPTFKNTFWKPFSQIGKINIPFKGRHHVYAQYRSPDGEVSDIFVRDLTADGLELSDQTDATINDEIVAVASPSTTISTSPPPGATHHSVSVDVEDLPRSWIPVSQPLPLSVRNTLEFCGRHTAYIKFKDANGAESPSLTRTWSVRCWDKNLPTSPLEPRYAHGAAALDLTPANGKDAVFLWGGRNDHQLFNNGAILKKSGQQWEWQMLPPAPIPGRIRPQIVVGENHVLVTGGEDLTGNAAEGWAFYNLSSDTWISGADFSVGTIGTPPPALKNSAASYVDVRRTVEMPDSLGAFLIVGGELNNQPQSSAISAHVYSLFERNGEIIKTWHRETSFKPVSRTTYSIGVNTNYFFVHSGITTPSGSGDYSLSGSEFELSGDLQVFYFDENGTDQPTFKKFHYPAVDSRTGVIDGHTFLLMRQQPTANLEPAEWIEQQLMCVYGGQKYSDVFPQACEGTLDGKIKLHLPFCRRIYDSYLFSPVARLGICFVPKKPSASGSTVGYLENFFLSMQGAPQERRLHPKSSNGINSATMQGALFFWSGMSATGGEYLADGKIYFSSADTWQTVTEFEAPAPRVDHTATRIGEQKKILIWGGKTAAGVTSGGAFYDLP